MTWFLVITIFGATVWNLGPMTEAECKGTGTGNDGAKAVATAYVDRLAADGASMVVQGRVVTRADVKIDCVPEAEL